MIKPRDSQRSKLYRTELYLQNGPLMGDLSECATLIRACLKWWGPNANPDAPPNIIGGRATSSARGGPRRISLPKWAWTPRVVVHETAHCITQRIYGFLVSGHGPEFVAVYTALYERFVDSGLTHDQIMGVWSAGGVRVATGDRATVPAREEIEYQPHEVQGRKGRVPIVDKRARTATAAKWETLRWREGDTFDADSWGINHEDPLALRTVMHEFERILRAKGLSTRLHAVDDRSAGRVRWEISFPFRFWSLVADERYELTKRIVRGELPGVAPKKIPMAARIVMDVPATSV